MVEQSYCGCRLVLHFLGHVPGFSFYPDAVVALEHGVFLLGHVTEIGKSVVQGIPVEVVGDHTEWSLGDESVHGDVDVFAVFGECSFGVPVVVGVDCSPCELAEGSYSVVVNDRKFTLR